jgi:quercetin dioxygenase-like cupin family protein
LLPDGRSDAISLYVGEVAPGAAGPGLHVHEFDQFYYVLSGALNVQVGLESSVARPGTLVTLPAGVPHRQWNEGAEIERHLALLVPSPTPGKPLDVGVSLALSDEVID